MPEVLIYRLLMFGLKGKQEKQADKKFLLEKDPSGFV